MRFLGFLGILALLAVPLGANAQQGPGDKQTLSLPFNASDGTSFSAEDMTGPAVTSVVDVRGLSWVTFFVSAAAVTGTQNITLTCEVGPTAADVNYALQSETVSAGSATLSDYIPLKSVTTAKKFPVTLNVFQKNFLQCDFTAPTDGTVDATLWGW